MKHNWVVDVSSFIKKCNSVVSFFLILIFVLLFSMPSQAASRAQELLDPYIIVIDPGHGGDNLGTETGWEPEKDMTMTTAWAMIEELRKYENVQVYLTRSDDSSMTLKERAAFAASVEADFLFSLHYNASVNHDLYGSEVWISVEPPYNAYGYQFGMIQMETMEEMELALRGVKSKYNEDNSDYYGILRESSANGVPAVIIEHCHVDNAGDLEFQDTDSKLKAFGRADATSVAKYLGLKSDSLNVDYSDYAKNDLPEVDTTRIQSRSIMDVTDPEECELDLLSADYSTGEIKLSVTAYDYDGMILSYAVSLDGGVTFSERIPWKNANTYLGTYSTVDEINVLVPDKKLGQIIVRVFNQYDLSLDSNCITLDQIVQSGPIVDVASVSGAISEGTDTTETTINTGEDPSNNVSESIETVINEDAINENTINENASNESSEASFSILKPDSVPSIQTFLLFALFIVGIIVLILLTIALVSNASSSGHRRNR